jgi:hypothetical protein
MSTAEIILGIVVALLALRDRNGWRSLRRYAKTTNENLLLLHKRIEKLEREAKR